MSTTKRTPSYFLKLDFWTKTASAAAIAALATKLLMLLRSKLAALSTSFLSSSVKYTRVFRPNRSLERRLDFEPAALRMRAMVPLRIEPSVCGGIHAGSEERMGGRLESERHRYGAGFATSFSGRTSYSGCARRS